MKVAARSVPKGNLRTCHRDRAHISGKTADRKRSLCKQSDNGRGEWRVSSSTPKMRRRHRRLAFRQVLSLYAFLKSRWNSHSYINLNKSKTCFLVPQRCADAKRFCFSKILTILSVDFVDTLRHPLGCLFLRRN